MYRNRWTIEAAFGEIAAAFHGEVNTLAYPPAALFAFCLALTMYNLLSVIKAAIRVAHKVDNETISTYHLAEEIACTYRGMMIVFAASLLARGIRRLDGCANGVEIDCLGEKSEPRPFPQASARAEKAATEKIQQETSKSCFH